MAVPLLHPNQLKAKIHHERQKIRDREKLVVAFQQGAAAVPPASGAAAELLSTYSAVAAPAQGPSASSTSTSFSPPSLPNPPPSSTTTTMPKLPDVPDLGLFERVKEECAISTFSMFVLDSQAVVADYSLPLVFDDLEEHTLRKLELLYTTKNVRHDDALMEAYAGGLNLPEELCQRWFMFRARLERKLSPERASMPPGSRGSTVVKREGSSDSAVPRQLNFPPGPYQSGPSRTTHSATPPRSPTHFHPLATPSASTSPNFPVARLPTPTEQVAGPSTAQPSSQHASTSHVQQPATHGPKLPFTKHARRPSSATTASLNSPELPSPGQMMPPPPYPLGQSSTSEPGPHRTTAKSFHSARATTNPYTVSRQTPLSVRTNIPESSASSPALSSLPSPSSGLISPLAIMGLGDALVDGVLDIARKRIDRARSTAPEPEELEPGEIYEATKTKYITAADEIANLTQAVIDQQHNY